MTKNLAWQRTKRTQDYSTMGNNIEGLLCIWRTHKFDNLVCDERAKLEHFMQKRPNITKFSNLNFGLCWGQQQLRQSDKQCSSNTYRYEGFYSLPSNISSFSVINLLKGFFKIPIPVMHLRIRTKKILNKNWWWKNHYSKNADTRKFLLA